MLNLTCTNEQKVKVTVNPTTAAGRPATLDGPLVLTVLSGDGTIVPVPGDPLAFYVVSGAQLAQSVFKVEGDADLGTGVRTIQDSVQLQVTGALASSFGMTASTAEPK